MPAAPRRAPVRAIAIRDEAKRARRAMAMVVMRYSGSDVRGLDQDVSHLFTSI